MTDQTIERPVLICDIETYHDFFLVCFKRLRDGKIVSIEISSRTDRADDQKKRDRMRAIMETHRIITYNGMSYDVPLIWYCIEGANNAQLKRASDQIINGNVKYWEVEQLLGIRIPRLDHIDLIEPQPNAFAGLKTLQGRLHGKKMQDLPIPPDARLVPEDMDNLTSYCGNDLDATFNVYDALTEPLELRAALSKQYGMNFLSKSDAQIGEGIIKKCVEQLTGEKVERVKTPAGTTFPYRIPEYMHFERPELSAILERLRTTEFYVQDDGKVKMPAWLDDTSITIGDSTYVMGIGGLHSTEANRALHADAETILVDFDVASYYPRIILGSGLYPKALGRAFLEVYLKIVNDRVEAKHKADDKSLSDAIRAVWKAMADGLKIAANGIFGKLGSIWSILYAPHLMVAVTLTGQLALLMLIERAEAMGIRVVSGNTDGVVFRVQRHMLDEIDKKKRVTGGVLKDLIEQWERDTSFEMEAVEYLSIYNESVNSYIAIKPDKTVKMKGPLNNPWRSGDGWKPDLRQQLMKNPQMTITTNAVVDFLLYGVSIEHSIRGGKDVRDFVTVTKVQGGGVWGDPATEKRSYETWTDTPLVVDHVVGLENCQYLGKVVRYYWSKNGEPIYYKNPHPKTGNFKKVSRSDSCRPLMELPDDYSVPADIDYDRYIEEAREILMDIGAARRPVPVKPLKLFKYNAIGWFAVAAS